MINVSLLSPSKVLKAVISPPFSKITSAIFEKGGDITALSTFEGDSSDTFIINIKVDGIELQELRELIQPLVIDILSVSED